jgi:hypothetical protein
MFQTPIDTQVPTPAPTQEALNVIQECLSRIRFGSIAITLHEGKVVQLDITEKRRVGR